MEINLNYIYQHKILMFEGKNSGKKKKFGSGCIPGDTCLISNTIYVLIPVIYAFVMNLFILIIS